MVDGSSGRLWSAVRLSLWSAPSRSDSMSIATALPFTRIEQQLEHHHALRQDMIREACRKAENSASFGWWCIGQARNFRFASSPQKGRYNIVVCPGFPRRRISSVALCAELNTPLKWVYAMLRSREEIYASFCSSNSGGGVVRFARLFMLLRDGPSFPPPTDSTISPIAHCCGSSKSNCQISLAI